jgi:SAM-dependent methyltransferase
MDLSPGGIELARRAHPGVEFVVGNAEDPPFANESFEIVFCRAISHLSRRELATPASARLLAEMTRLVRPGGLLLISYYTRRDGGGTPEHAWHRVSDLLELVEPAADPFHIDVVGHYVQIGAQRWDAPRRRRRSARPVAAPASGKGPGPSAPQRIRRGLGRIKRNLASKGT